MNGMLQSSTATARVIALGIDPILEPQVSKWHTQLVNASLPSGEQGKALPSQWLEQNDLQGILLGLPLARQLDVTVGDKVVMTYQGKQEVQSYLFRVRGVVSTGAIGPYSMLVIATMNGFQKALNEALALHKITFHISDLKVLEQLSDHLMKWLTTDQAKSLLSDQPYVLKNWKQALPALYQFTLKDRQSAMAVFVVIALIIMIGVLNTITMSVLERTRSFGVMLAIGISPQSVAGLILAE
jgi:putative ABC transport system permease protein